MTKTQEIKDHIIKEVNEWDGKQAIVFRRLDDGGPTLTWHHFKSDAAKELQFMIDEAKHTLLQLPPSTISQIVSEKVNARIEHLQQEVEELRYRLGIQSEELRKYKDATTPKEERAIHHEQLCDDQAHISRLEIRIRELEQENEWLHRKLTIERERDKPLVVTFSMTTTYSR